MKKRNYQVYVEYVFNGSFFIEASSKEEAKELVQRHCGLVLGGDVHSSLDDIDWEFEVHPYSKIKTVKSAG